MSRASRRGRWQRVESRPSSKSHTGTTELNGAHGSKRDLNIFEKELWSSPCPCPSVLSVFCSEALTSAAASPGTTDCCRPALPGRRPPSPSEPSSARARPAARRRHHDPATAAARLAGRGRAFRWRRWRGWRRREALRLAATTATTTTAAAATATATAGGRLSGLRHAQIPGNALEAGRFRHLDPAQLASRRITHGEREIAGEAGPDVIREQRAVRRVRRRHVAPGGVLLREHVVLIRVPQREQLGLLRERLRR